MTNCYLSTLKDALSDPSVSQQSTELAREISAAARNDTAATIARMNRELLPMAIYGHVILCAQEGTE